MTYNVFSGTLNLTQSIKHLFPNGLQSDFQLISYLMLRLEFMILFQHGAPDVTVQWVHIWIV